MYRGKAKNEDQVSNSNLKEKSGPIMSTSTRYISVAVQVAVVCVAVLIIFKTITNAGIVLYTFHPTLMAVGYLILLGEGILAMSGLSSLADGYSHNQRVSAHWVIQTIGMILITIAQSCIYINKDINGYPHYSTIHSWCGLVTYLLTIGATLGGVGNKYSTQLKLKPVQLKIAHGFAGAFVYVCACGTICVGLNQVWTDEKDAELKLGAMVVIFLSCFYIVYQSLQTAIRRAVYM
ncbi:hypothetical protein PVAND_013393 [Polypedilum vanderplanki]|uniref:ascorbate ferrireductase (transmembrane) n=1 Tax=Polypedilum vanderplanki TaxID=319348 RepID=A0A9J6CQC5_POLVA|nr:hypothetical protein PVAND_013393 [Polypedilum vanderplanki]